MTTLLEILEKLADAASMFWTCLGYQERIYVLFGGYLALVLLDALGRALYGRRRRERLVLVRTEPAPEPDAAA